MTTYLITLGRFWVVDESGAFKSVAAGSETTLRADYVVSLAAVIEVAGSGARVAIPVQADPPDWTSSGWTAADAAGMRVVPAVRGVVVHARNFGPSTRTIDLLGPDPVQLVLEPGQEDYALADPARFTPLLAIDVDDPQGVSFLAVQKG